MDVDNETFETRSQCSSVSRTSQLSSVSAIAARARAKAEAARAQATFAQKEAWMMKEQAYIEAEATKKKAELQANLHTLRLEGAAAAAIAEAQALEAAAMNERGDFERASLRSEHKEHKYIKSHSHLDTEPLASSSAPARQQVDSGEAAKSYPGESKQLPSELSEHEYCDLPVPYTVSNQQAVQLHAPNPSIKFEMEQIHQHQGIWSLVCQQQQTWLSI